MSLRLRAVRLVGVGVVGAVLVLAVAPGVASARLSSSTKAKGPITCALTGTLTANPPLSLGSGKATVLTFTASLGACTGNASASKITGGTVTGKSVDTSASCVGFENAFPSLAGKVVYKTSGKSLGKTTIAFSGGTLNYTATPLSVTYPKHGGKGVAKNAFAIKKAKMTLVLSVPYTAWVSTCQTPTGLATMTLAAGSSITV